MQKLVRTSTAAAGLVAALALALTGCGGDSGDSAKDEGGATAPSGTGGEGSGSTADSGSGADAASVEGTWAGLSDGKTVALSVKSGKVALVADQHVCQGAVEDMGEPMFSLKCADGNTDRTMGTIESNDGKTLVISWGKGVKDTLTKAGDGKLPSELPTDLPTS
ncbi:hypothetical protein OIE62_23545 [Streptomyces scopuliridis]|uniref:Uncharacterized protein n=1 Tax=Streptomyces scopuliridis TaxID=452529 RepID=A0ACD4ZYJ1_9ACTN|nr:hypothetical protein [Streptomyces scopuliridis]WSC03092.1 hypothetical protein OG835_17400 [Streptomyces scopuliridis]WSC11032.1 hypothetical protein OIE62_23545 [Streptomyces scopuliridis]